MEEIVRHRKAKRLTAMHHLWYSLRLRVIFSAPNLAHRMNIVQILFLVILFFSSFAGSAYASGDDCQVIYGGGYSGSQSCAKLTIDKKVQKPGGKDFVDELSGSDPMYSENQEVLFKIVVQNTGSDKLSDVIIIDTLPQYLTYASGTGSFDAKKNTLTIKLSKPLESGKSQEYIVKMKVVAHLPFVDGGFFCVTNAASVTEKEGASANDSTQLCLEKKLKVYPTQTVKQTPETGPEAMALPILFGMGGFGWYLKRKK